jgi:cell division protein FtsZ
MDKIHHINAMNINKNLNNNQHFNSFEHSSDINNLNHNHSNESIQDSDQEEYFKQQIPKISVIGVGGAGGNAANNMIRDGLKVNFLAANTDAQALSMSMAKTKIQLGANLTKGFGAGGIPEIGKESAEESKGEILSHLSDSDMIFITAGMGGGTGTGAAPMIAQYLQEHREKTINEQGVQYGLTSLSIGVVTKPFNFEGPRKAALAARGLEEMKKYVDTLIVVPNQNLFRIANEKTTFKESFAKADEVLGNAIRCISGLITDAGLINVDFADVRSVLSKRGKAVIGIGVGTGDERAIIAALDAMSNPILDQVSFKKAKALLVSVTGGDDLTLFEIDAALNRIRDEIDEDANIIFGSVYDESKTGSISVSVVATGIEDENSEIKSDSDKTTKKKFYTFDEKTHSKNSHQYNSNDETTKNQHNNVLSNDTVELNIDGQNINLEIDEKLKKLGVYEELKETEKKKVGVLARLGFDIPAYLRKKKDKE